MPAWAGAAVGLGSSLPRSAAGARVGVREPGGGLRLRAGGARLCERGAAGAAALAQLADHAAERGAVLLVGAEREGRLALDLERRSDALAVGAEGGAAAGRREAGDRRDARAGGRGEHRQRAAAEALRLEPLVAQRLDLAEPHAVGGPRRFLEAGEEAGAAAAAAPPASAAMPAMTPALVRCRRGRARPGRRARARGSSAPRRGAPRSREAQRERARGGGAGERAAGARPRGRLLVARLAEHVAGHARPTTSAIAATAYGKGEERSRRAARSGNGVPGGVVPAAAGRGHGAAERRRGRGPRLAPPP